MDEFQGAITGIADGHIVGWAWRPNSPQSKVSLEIWLGSHRLGTCDATLFDPELRAKGLGDGHHGFRFRPSAVPEVDFPATIFGCVADSDHYLGGSLLIGSAQELLARLAMRRREAPANETIAAAPASQARTPVQPASPPPAPPPAAPKAGPSGEAAAGVEQLTAQLTKLRDMIGQALIERVEAQLTILRDEFDREMQLVRRDLAALAARLPPEVDRTVQRQQTMRSSSATPTDLVDEATTAASPVQDDRPREILPSAPERPERPREGGASPLKYQRFAPVTAPRPSAPPLPGRGARRQT
jgi:hypothetical protein